MSDSFYTGLRDSTAGPLIEKYGMALTLVRVTEGAYDPSTGKNAASTTASYPDCFGLIDKFTASERSNPQIRNSDIKLLLSAKGLTITPQIGDQFTMPDGTWYIPEGDGATYNPVEPLAPGGIPVMYTIQLRK